MSDTDQREISDAPAIRRRRAPKGEMRRAALLDAATDVIARNGYWAASMREIADMAGITSVGLLHHFPNKTALLQALLDRRDQRMRERFGDLQAQPTLEGFLDFVRLNMRFTVQSVRECQALLMINVESLSQEHPAWAWQQEKFGEVHVHAQAHLQLLCERGEIRADVDTRALATELFAVMEGLQIQWLRRPDEVDVEATLEGYLQRMAAGIRARP